MHHLKTLRLVLGILVGATTCIVFFDSHSLIPESFKERITSAQFMPAVMSVLGGASLAAATCASILALTALIGRIYCSILCPLGLLQDAIARLVALGRKICGNRLRLPYEPPRQILRQALLIATILALVFGWKAFIVSWLDPYSQFGRIMGSIFRLPVTFANNLLSTFFPNAVPRISVPWVSFGALLPPLFIFSAIAILSALRGRLYCNLICPVGSLLGWISSRALVRIAIDKTSCVRCGDCQRVCKAQCINLKTQEVDMSRCVSCFNCVAICDEHGILPSLLGKAKARGKLSPKPRPATTLTTANSSSTPGSKIILSRRSFLTSTGTAAAASTLAWLGHDKTLNTASAIAPPGAQSRARFVEHCTACQLCVSACPEHVLEPATTQYGQLTGFMKPHMNFNRSFCNINCTVCCDICPDDALLPITLDTKKKTRLGIASVDLTRCLVRTDDFACGACAEHCPTAALQFVKGPARFNEPQINQEHCIGCGACQFACPVKGKAIRIRALEIHEMADELQQEDAKDPNADKSAAGEFPF
ncbi:MAG: 4Fe-4S dicluster domain-containing protein [Puniceicoccales bacterium]|jgi:ferredoxin|nr:4Fe-4S dicluster domain-containing protein [Puniceicoccales bacterium]